MHDKLKKEGLKASDDSRRAVLLVGPPGSGASLAARVLSLMGLELEGPAAARGTSRQISEVHDHLLAALGSSRYDLRALPRDWIESAAAETARRRLREVLESRLERASLWGAHEAALCRLLPLWLELLDEAGVTPCLAIAVRDPLEAAAQLADRDGLPEATAVALYLDHMMAALDHSERRARAFIYHENLLHDWQTEVERAASELKLEWPRGIEPPRGEIGGLIDSGGQAEVPVRDGMAELAPFRWATELHLALLAGGDGSRRRTSRELDRLRRNWDTATGLYLPELSRLAAEREVDRDRRAAAERRLELNARQLEELRRELAAATNGLDAEGALTARLERAGRLEEELIDLRRRETELQARLHESELRQTRLEHKAQRTRAELDKVQHHLTRILSGRLFRYTRGLRHLWYRVRRHG